MPAMGDERVRAARSGCALDASVLNSLLRRLQLEGRRPAELRAAVDRMGERGAELSAHSRMLLERPAQEQHKVRAAWLKRWVRSRARPAAEAAWALYTNLGEGDLARHSRADIEAAAHAAGLGVRR